MFVDSNYPIKNDECKVIKFNVAFIERRIVNPDREIMRNINISNESKNRQHHF